MPTAAKYRGGAVGGRGGGVRRGGGGLRVGILLEYGGRRAQQSTHADVADGAGEHERHAEQHRRDPQR
ncbi:MAG: hypothetical protein QM747_07065 [Nocardioides sp.]